MYIYIYIDIYASPLHAALSWIIQKGWNEKLNNKTGNPDDVTVPERAETLINNYIYTLYCADQ